MGAGQRVGPQVASGLRGFPSTPLELSNSALSVLLSSSARLTSSCPAHTAPSRDHRQSSRASFRHRALPKGLTGIFHVESRATSTFLFWCIHMSTDTTLGYFTQWRLKPTYVGTKNKNMRFRLSNFRCVLLFVIKTRLYPSISFIYEPIHFSSDFSLVVQAATLVLNFSFADLIFVFKTWLWTLKVANFDNPQLSFLISNQKNPLRTFIWM